MATRVENPRTNGPGRAGPGAFLIINLEVLNWNAFKDLFLTQISMLTAWAKKSLVNGAHELFTPETLCCQVMHRSKEKMEGRKMSRLQKSRSRSDGFVGPVGFGGSDGSAGYYGVDGFDGFDGCCGRDGCDGFGGLFQSVEPIGAVRDG